MRKTYAVTVRWPAVAERVEYADAASVEEACAIVMRGEAQDLGDVDYFDDDAGDHWITRIESSESDDPRVAPVSQDVPPAYEQKHTPQEMADELLQHLRMAMRQLDRCSQCMEPGFIDVREACAAVIQRAEEGNR